jgi:F5/8 type C domain-containing protein
MRPRSRFPACFAAGFYVVLAAAITWPLVLHPGSVVPNDLGDPLLNIWLMAWNARVVPLTAAWWNTPQFFPIDGTMAFSEHLLGLSVITTPVILSSGNPLLGYNAAFFLSFVLGALSAYFLSYSISGRHDCAFVAGLAFGFAPYRMAQLAHVQVLSAYWMPLALAGLHLYFQDRRTRWVVLFAAAWLMQALACGYYLFYLSVLVILWLLWFAAGRERAASVARVVFAWAVAIALMGPLLYGYWKYQRAYGLRRGPDEIMAFSADVASLLKAPGNLRLWGWLDVADRPESTLFPGITAVVLTIAGLAIAWGTMAGHRVRRLAVSRVLVGGGLICTAVAASALYFGNWKVQIGGLRLLSVGVPHKPFSLALLFFTAAAALHPAVRTAWLRRSALAFYALAAAVMWLFSLGPQPTLMNRPFIYKAPYAWLMMVPGVDGVRVPARFWMLAVLCLAVAAGLAVRQLTARWPRLGPMLPVLACLGLLSDSWPAAMRMYSPPDMRPSHARATARLELPIYPAHDTIVLYRATEHRRPTFNGYSGYFAPHYWALQYLLDQHDPAVLTRLSAFGPIEVVIDHALDEDGGWRTFVGGHPQAQPVYQDEQYSAYRVQRAASDGALPAIKGEPLPIASISANVNAGLTGGMTDDDLLTRWHAGREQRAGDSMTVDLGQPHQVNGAQMRLGGYVADFPRQLSIETSTDGQRWFQAWSGGTGLMAFSAALDDPRAVTLPFTFEPHQARLVRFTQTGTEGKYEWSVAELRVLGVSK